MANRFWVGGTGTWDASDTTHWSASSGGAGGSSVPGSSDTATLDGSSGGGIVTVNTDFTLTTLTMNAFTGTLDFSVNNNSPTIGTFNCTGTATRTLNMGSGTWTITGTGISFNIGVVTNLTLDEGTSNVVISNTSASSKTVAIGNTQAIYDLTVVAGGSGAVIFNGNFTLHSLMVTGPNTLTFQAGATKTFTGDIDLEGGPSSVITISSESSGSAFTLSKGSGLVNGNYLSLKDSHAIGGASWFAGDSSTNVSGNSGWVFTNPGQYLGDTAIKLDLISEVTSDAGVTVDGLLIKDGALPTTTINSSTYTPTRSAEANLDSNVTMTEAQYMRVGATVTVSGRFTADPTLTATTTSFEITLPVASNIGAAEDAAGVAFCGSIVSQGAEVIGVAANDTAKVQWKAGDVTSQTWSYTFSYQVI